MVVVGDGDVGVNVDWTSVLRKEGESILKIVMRKVWSPESYQTGHNSSNALTKQEINCTVEYRVK